MTAPIELDEARAVIRQAIEKIAGTTVWLPNRAEAVELQDFNSGSDSLHLKVWDANEPDNSPGADFLVSVQRLAHCDTHHRFFPARDRLCDLCVIEQVQEDR